MNARALLPAFGLVVAACASTADAPPRVATTHTTSAVTSSGVDPRRILARAAHYQSELVDHCGPLQTDNRYSTTLRLVIAPNGAVDLADARGTHTRVDACIAEIARRWMFDPAAGPTVTDIPIVLER